MSVRILLLQTRGKVTCSTWCIILQTKLSRHHASWYSISVTLSLYWPETSTRFNRYCSWVFLTRSSIRLFSLLLPEHLPFKQNFQRELCFLSFEVMHIILQHDFYLSNTCIFISEKDPVFCSTLLKEHFIHQNNLSRSLVLHFENVRGLLVFYICFSLQGLSALVFLLVITVPKISCN